MKLFRLAFRGETAIPMLGLLFASVVSAAMVVAKVIVAKKLFFGFLIWNLFLAWVPLLLALVTCDQFEQSPRKPGRLLACAASWMLFFPNSPYIFTDLIHLTASRHHYWMDMFLILTCAITGLAIGFVSLFLMQSLVRRRYGWLAGWFFISGVSALSGVGIYVGRFLRLNSWDVLFRPIQLFERIGGWLTNPRSQPVSPLFPVLFATFLFMAYVLLYALTHLRPLPALESVEALKR